MRNRSLQAVKFADSQKFDSEEKKQAFKISLLRAD
jgi:hypothetical protein